MNNSTQKSVSPNEHLRLSGVNLAQIESQIQPIKIQIYKKILKCSLDEIDCWVLFLMF